MTLAIGLESIKRLTNLADINRALHETHAKERSIEAELEELLSKRTAIEDTFVTLHDSASEALEGLLADAEQLAGSVHSTAELSERVSKKVRELDTAQSRIHDTLQRINLTVDRSSAVDGIKAALATGDFEAAAEHVSKYLQLDKQFSDVTDELDSHQLQEQRAVLQEAKGRLRNEILDRLDAAKKAGDHASVLRFTRLYAPLGLQEEGLESFLEYLRGLISTRAEEDYSALVESAAGTEKDYVNTLTNLFKDIALAIDENEGFVGNAFGPEAVLTLISGLQQLCDQYGAKLLERYVKHRRLQQLISETSTLSHARRTSAPAQATLAVDPRQIEGFLEEMVLLCQRSEEYNQFVVAKIGAVGSAAKTEAAARETSFRGGAFNMAVRELVSYYMALEEFYLEENVEKAIAIDEWSPDALTTSMVDDVFFILQKCGGRALAIGSLQCLCAILGQLNNLLRDSLRSALEYKWKAAAARLAQAVAAATGGEGANAPSGDAAEYAAVFNNAEISAMYVGKLRTELEESAWRYFHAPAERERIRSVLVDLSQTALEFTQITHKALEQLSSGVAPRLRAPLDEAANASYELTDAEYASNEVEDTWVDHLLGILVAMLQWLQPLLTPSNYDTLVASLLQKVVDRLEATLRVKRFNQLGGLQLDRDVRHMVVTLSEVTQRTVRDKFAVLSQMGTLLSLEGVSEVMDYWDSSTTWRLTDAQVKEILGQRTDFDPLEIASLDL
ncbi:g12271 [Coccomyxa viridis]|uniref:Conserved oligomeric Golgi complex subunit 4 n=1 Tax=Coccomyxa viridis TaxID=1274662 RepID=A0ABP1G9Y6_9CHLO